MAHVKAEMDQAITVQYEAPAETVEPAATLMPLVGDVFGETGASYDHASQVVEGRLVGVVLPQAYAVVVEGKTVVQAFNTHGE